MAVALLVALYGGGQPAEAKDPLEGVGSSGNEASASATVVLTAQKNAEPESDVVEQADLDYRLPPHVYVECGYAEGVCDSASATASATASARASDTEADPRSEDILDAFFKPATLKVVVTVLIGWVGNVVLTVLLELIEWFDS